MSESMWLVQSEENADETGSVRPFNVDYFISELGLACPFDFQLG